MTVLVTGGGGFLGGAIVRLLRARGNDVVSYSRNAYPELDEIGARQFCGDLAERKTLEAAMHGCDAVVHVAAKAGVWGREEDYFHTNVAGTESVLAACKTAGVSRLVFTSTPSVVHTGGDIEGGDESLPYAAHFEAAYPKTKAIAEKSVLAANGPALATVALRPHLIWGPGDPHLIPRLLARARSGKLRRIGSRDTTIDVTYIDNAAEAHVLALDKLAVGSRIAGKAYFITNGEPVKQWEFLNRVLNLTGLPSVKRTVPKWIANVMAQVLEARHRLLKLDGEPKLTRFAVSQLSTSHWFDISAARRDLGYAPRVSVEEGLRKLKASFTVAAG